MECPGRRRVRHRVAFRAAARYDSGTFVNRRWTAPGIAFIFSLGLSCATVGTHPSWQDSGLFLTAVK